MNTAQQHRIPFQQAAFLLSAEKLSQCPPDEGCEVAFAGRSNAGKSSAINAITGQKKLARISKTPGRTQLINFFTLQSEQRRLVDLPGYGYAKVPEAIKLRWQRYLEAYLSQRGSLKGLILLMDIRHPMQAFDTMMLNWAAAGEMPIHILLTKADKHKRGAAQNQLLSVRRALAEQGFSATIQLFSALKKTGLDEAQQQLTEWLTP